MKVNYLFEDILKDLLMFRKLKLFKKRVRSFYLKFYLKL